jgi:hypothetical protein
MPGLKGILHGNEYWYAEAENRRVRKEHGRWRNRKRRGYGARRKRDSSLPLGMTINTGTDELASGDGIVAINLMVTV